MNKFGKPVLDPEGEFIILDPNGKPRSSDGRPYYLDKDKNLVNGPDDKPMLVGLDGNPVTSDGMPILLDKNKEAIFGQDGKPIIIKTYPTGKLV